MLSAAHSILRSFVLPAGADPVAAFVAAVISPSGREGEDDTLLRQLGGRVGVEIQVAVEGGIPRIEVDAPITRSVETYATPQ